MDPTKISQFKPVPESIEDRKDINAAAVSPYLKADDHIEFKAEETSVRSSTNLYSEKKPQKLIPRIIEGIRNIFGNYIVNEASEENTTEEIGTTTQALTADERTSESSSSAPVSSAEDTESAAADEINRQIEDEEFRLNHGGLSRQEFAQLLADLRAAGMDDVADYLEEHPEYTSEIIDMLADPEGYWDRLES